MRTSDHVSLFNQRFVLNVVLLTIFSTCSRLVYSHYGQVSNTTLWTLYLLGHNKDKQQKLYEEIIKVAPKGTLPTKEHIDHMPYLKGVIRESLRYMI